MQTSRFQLGLIAGLATALGFSLSSSDAVGYPAGAAIATGHNPVVSASGHLEPSSSYELVSGVLTAPSEQDLIITDVVLTMYGYSGSSACLKRVTFDTSEGTIAEYRLVSDTDYSYDNLQPTQVAHSYSSGLPVQPGDTLVLTHHTGGGDCDVSYSLSGYYAQP